MSTYIKTALGGRQNEEAEDGDGGRRSDAGLVPLCRALRLSDTCKVEKDEEGWRRMAKDGQGWARMRKDEEAGWEGIRMADGAAIICLRRD